MQVRRRYTVLPGAMPGPEQCPLTNIRTGAENEAIKPRTIVNIAMSFSVELYRP
jgi:hypothetical protein